MMTSDMLMTVEGNPWLACALGLAARIFLPGLAWGWALAFPAWPAAIRGGRWLEAGARVVFAGLLIALFNAAFLAELGLYTSWFEWASLLALSAPGLWMGRRQIAENARSAAPALALILAGFIAIMLLPRQGEWIVGGWDPGVYLTQGVHVGRTGTFRPPPDPVYSRMTPDELRVFTRGVVNFTEGHPVYPLDPETRSFQLFFFRLTPALIALLEHGGGLRAAVRVNLFMGFLAAWMFAALLAAMVRHRGQFVLSLLLLAAHPLWLYHLHIPTSELLQFFLLCGAGAMIPVRSIRIGGLALAFFAMMANRFSFLPFGVLLILLSALMDFPRADRRRVALERWALLGALAAGVLYDYATAAVTIERLAFIVPQLFQHALFLLVLVLGVDGVADKTAWREAVLKLFQRIEPWLVAAGAAVLASVVAGVFFLPGGALYRMGIERAFPYWGAGYLLAALAGLIFLLAHWRRETSLLKAWVLFLLAATAVTLMNKAIANLYPWATRRFVEFTVPLLALLGGLGLAGWTHRLKSKAGGMLSLLLALAVVGASARMSWHAWTRTEFNGFSRMMAQIAEQVHDTDILVADHFLYGTPLRFIQGLNVLNGEALWTQKNPRVMQKALSTLACIARPGERICFLTSVPEGLGLYPAPIAPVELVWESDPFDFEDIQHHPRASGFSLRTRHRQFRLYVWTPEN